MDRARKVGRRLSYLLRHRPDSAGLVLDAAGWVPVGAVLEALRAGGLDVSLAELERVVETNDKRRFVLRDGRIRASQGHSVDVVLGYAPGHPPAVLFHGTVERALASILAHGLVRGARHHVHLSVTFETARAVGARRGRPVVLRVDAAAMVAAGHVFYRSDNDVWLTDGVPAAYVAPSPAP